jgi:hypothetical protein
MEGGLFAFMQPQVPRKLDLKILLRAVHVLHAQIWRDAEIFNQYRLFSAQV